MSLQDRNRAVCNHKEQLPDVISSKGYLMYLVEACAHVSPSLNNDPIVSSECGDGE